MQYEKTCEAFALLAQRQSNLVRRAPLSFLAGAMLAGAFVSIGSILSLSVGAHLGPEVRPLVMGAVFGISILLTVFGGAELFNGQVMFVSFGMLRGKLTVLQALRTLTVVWVGNLIGVVLLCGLFAIGGGGHVFGPTTILHDLVEFKTHSSPLSLLARGILCNFLACLGIWSAARLHSDSAKMVVLAWCVLAYVASGLEHSVANMGLFSLGLMAPVPVGTFASAVISLLIVSLGNLIGGGLLVGGAYSLYSHGDRLSSASLHGTAESEAAKLVAADAAPARVATLDATPETVALGLPHLSPAVQNQLATLTLARPAASPKRYGGSPRRCAAPAAERAPLKKTAIG